jgi:D-alanyl-D-alanine carboxypeptidase
MAPPSPSARLATILEAFRTQHGFPGATAAIVLPDGSVVTAATGVADLDSQRPMSPDTPMLAASIGKSFVAATVLQLEDEERLARGQLLSVHLGGRPWFDALPNAAEITINHLLHHTAGLPDHVHTPAFQADFRRLAAAGARFDPEQLMAYVAGKDALFAPGQAWSYSDTGYVLLGLVIEEVTGAVWHDVVRAQLIVPLGLEHTLASNRRDLPGLAVGYTDPDNPFDLPARTADDEGRLLWNPAVESAGGGFVSTSADLARWGQRLFAGQALQRPYLDRLLDGAPVDPGRPFVLYGAGVAIHAETANGPVYGHGGSIPGFVSSLRHYADHDVTVAFQINSDAGLSDDRRDMVPSLEAELAVLAVALAREIHRLEGDGRLPPDGGADSL